MSTLKTILSIDGSKTVHVFLDRCLAGSSFQLIHVLSPKEGLTLLESEGSEIALILMDGEMQEQNGSETLVDIRRLSRFVPVILLSSKSSIEDIQRMINSGVAEYVMKPFTPDILLAKIELVLGVS